MIPDRIRTSPPGNREQRQRYAPPLLHAVILSGCIVEHPFGTIKYRIFGYPRLLLRGLAGAKIELGLAIMVYNLKRMMNVLSGRKPFAAMTN
jgi:hypothetical protein